MNFLLDNLKSPEEFLSFLKSPYEKIAAIENKTIVQKIPLTAYVDTVCMFEPNRFSYPQMKTYVDYKNEIIVYSRDTPFYEEVSKIMNAFHFSDLEKSLLSKIEDELELFIEQEKMNIQMSDLYQKTYDKMERNYYKTIVSIYLGAKASYRQSTISYNEIATKSLKSLLEHNVGKFLNEALNPDSNDLIKTMKPYFESIKIVSLLAEKNIKKAAKNHVMSGILTKEEDKLKKLIQAMTASGAQRFTVYKKGSSKGHLCRNEICESDLCLVPTNGSSDINYMDVDKIKYKGSYIYEDL